VKAVRVHEYKVDPKIDDIPEPEIQGVLDVIVKIGGAGVCRTDLHIVDGDWAAIQDPDLPYVIGHENAGWVHAVGDAVTNVRVADTVILHPQPSCGLCLACRAGRDMQCTGGAFFPGLSNNDGGMAEYLRTTARACVKLNEDTNPADVAALADAGITAYHAVRKAVPMLWPGTSAVVIGAGGLGHIGVQALAALTATKIIVVDKNPDALELAKQIGADETVLADGNQVGEVQELTGGGATVVFDFVAEQGVELEAWQMTGPAGYQFVLGYGGQFQAPTLDFVAGEKNVIGNIVGTYNDLVELMVLAQAGKVTLHTKQYALDSALDALHDLDAGKVRGRAILVP
jgi:NAD+-dependent secondary alcohol dehydrogenase Adh1